MLTFPIPSVTVAILGTAKGWGPLRPVFSSLRLVEVILPKIRDITPLSV